MKTEYMENQPKLSATLWVTVPVLKVIEQILEQVDNPAILEFGAGCSTLFFAQQTPNLVSIEHHPEWYERVQAGLKDLGLVADLRLVPSNYYLECASLPVDHFDLVFIDGQHRMECLQAARSLVKPGGVVMLDDSNYYEKYQLAEQIMADWPKLVASGEKSNPLSLQPDRKISETKWWVRPI